MNLKEAASRLGLHYQAAYRHVRSGRLTAVKLANGYEISEEALARFVADDRVWQRTLRPDGRLRRRRTDDPDRTADDLETILPGPGDDPRPGVVLVARALAATLGDSVVVLVDGADPVHEHGDPHRHLLLSGPAAELHQRVAARVVARARRDGTRHIPLVQQRDVPAMAGPIARGALGEIGVHSLVVAPVAVRGATVGVLVCSRDHAGQPYGVDDARRVERYAALVARALAVDGADAGADLPRAG